MKIITNPSQTDGFGTQYYSILCAGAYSDLSRKEFRYTPFSAMEHNYDRSAKFIEEKEMFINLINHFPINTDLNYQKQIEWYRGIYHTAFNENILYCTNTATFQKMKGAFFEGKQKSSYFDSAHVHVAIHIRRRNSHDVCCFTIDNPFYLVFMNNLRKTFPSNHFQFHIFSQGQLEQFEDLRGVDVVFHLNQSIENTFASMVFADILLIAPSSLSYTAALLSDGTIFYFPFWSNPMPHWIRCEFLIESRLSPVTIDQREKNLFMTPPPHWSGWKSI